VAVRPEWTVGRALDHIRERGHESETLNVVYVVDPQWRGCPASAFGPSAAPIAGCMNVRFAAWMCHHRSTR
jgi:hypothetical protein